MTKTEDIPLREKWPTLYKWKTHWLIKLGFPIFAAWTIYIGLDLLFNHVLGWPMNQPLVPEMSYQAYQQYVQNQQQTEEWLGPTMGFLFLFLGAWFSLKVSKLYRKREVQKEE